MSMVLKVFEEVFFERSSRAGLKGRGARGNFYWRAPVT